MIYTGITDNPAADYDSYMINALSRCCECGDRKIVTCDGCDAPLCLSHATQRQITDGWRYEYWCEECLGDAGHEPRSDEP